eukprot:scaffold1039_cov101-Cylindrotheca_fusiformis.AAC.5
MSHDGGFEATRNHIVYTSLEYKVRPLLDINEVSKCQQIKHTDSFCVEWKRIPLETTILHRKVDAPGHQDLICRLTKIDHVLTS